MKNISAYILCAGLGTRMKPITNFIPKPCIPFKNKTLLEHTIDKLLSININKIIINLHHLPEHIIKITEKYKQLDFIFLKEKNILGTGGAIKNAYSKNILPENILIVNCDVYLKNFPLKKMIEYHLKNKNNATLSLMKNNNFSYTKFLIDKNKNIRFIENIYETNFNSNKKYFFSGVQIINKKILKFLPKKNKFCIFQNFYKKILTQGYPVKGFIHKNRWYDLGDINNYIKINKQYFNKKYKNKGIEEKYNLINSLLKI